MQSTFARLSSRVRPEEVSKSCRHQLFRVSGKNVATGEVSAGSHFMLHSSEREGMTEGGTAGKPQGSSECVTWLCRCIMFDDDVNLA
jgi:hypothetical protein